jgi:hypothetical protein
MAKPGISFIMRIRNEEAYLQACLDSLKPLTVPHEIVAILHKCTDRSKQIIQEAQLAGQPIRIFETHQNLSRAGYETLATPASSPESLVHFYTWCFSKAIYRWTFKWDADFIASKELLEFLTKGLVLDEIKPITYVIPCKMTDTIINREKYLHNCLVGFTKHVFWEVPSFTEGVETRAITPLIHTIPPSILKPYWLEPPWFTGTGSPVEENYKKIIYYCGTEPFGSARASSALCDFTWAQVMKNRGPLEMEGISLFS